MDRLKSQMGNLDATGKSFSNQKYYPYLSIVAIICLIIIGLQIFLLIKVEYSQPSISGLFHADFIIVTIVILTLLLGVGLVWMIRSRKMTVEALHSKSDELESFFANSIDMLCIADTDGFFRLLNPEWKRVLGYSISELEGKRFLDFVHPEDVEKTMNVANQLSNKQSVNSFVNRYRHKEGSYRWIEWRSYPVGKLIYASARDITERKTVEEEFQKVFTFQKAILDNVGYAIISSTLSGVITSFNKAAEFMLGYEAEELVGKKTPVIFHDQEETRRHAAMLSQKLGKYVEPGFESYVVEARLGNPQEYEWSFIRKDSTRIPVLLKVTAMYNKDMQISGFLGVVANLTERKLAEEEMHRTEFWLRESQRHSHIGSYNFNIASGTWKSSEELDAIFGISEDYERSVNGWVKFIQPEHQQEMTEHLLEHVIHQHNTFDKVYRIIRQNDGEVRWVHGLGYLNFDHDGNPVQMVGTIQDITDHRKSEESIRLSELKYRLLFENMTSGFALHQMIYNDQGTPIDYRYIEANPAFEKLTGTPISALLGHTVKEIMPNTEDHWIQTFGRVAMTGESISYMNYAQELGKYYDTYVFSPEKDKFAVIFNDATVRVRAEEELKVSEKKFADIFNLSPNVVGILRCSDRKLIDANPAYTELTGYVKDENINSPSMEVNLWVYPEERERMFLELKEKGEVSNFEMNLRSKDGSLHRCLFSVKGITYNNEECYIFIIHDITRLKEAENALRLSEQKFSNIYNLSPDMVGISRLSDGKILDGNPAMTRLTGYCFDEYIGKSTLELSLWANPEDRNVALATLKEKGEIKNFEIGMRIKDGTVLTCLFSATTLSYLNEPCLLFVVNDITERKKAEIALKESETKARLFVEHTPLPVAMFDNNMRYIMVSKRWSIDYNLGDQPLIGRSHYEIFPEISEVWKADHQRVLEGEIFKIEADRFERADGSMQWLRYELHPWRKDDGQVGGMVMFTEDITERKQNEDALQKRVLALTRPLNDPESIQFTDLFNIDELQVIQDTFAEATGVASIITYPDGRPITNPSNFCRLCNIIRSTTKGQANCFKSDAALGKQNNQGPSIQPCLSGGLWDAGASITLGGLHMANWLIGQVKNEVQDERVLIKYADEIGADPADFKQALSEVTTMSKSKFETISKSLYLLANELSLKAYQNVQQARFIAERDKAVEEIKLLNESLEKKVMERTSQLERANKDLESFAYSVSHDLRAPLRHIDGFARLMYSKMDSPNPQIVNYFEKIEASSKRMSSMIDDLLSFSRLGRRELILSAVDLNIILTEIAEQVKPDIGNRQVNWNISKLPKIKGDKNLLKMVLENLISNAIKYTSKKDVALIEIGVAEESDNLVEIFVKDNGVGFNMTYVDKLFGVFQRLHSSEEFEGTGIGLANVKQIVLKHNGTIRAEGKLNEGSIFYITLPK